MKNTAYSSLESTKTTGDCTLLARAFLVLYPSHNTPKYLDVPHFSPRHRIFLPGCRTPRVSGTKTRRDDDDTHGYSVCSVRRAAQRSLLFSREHSTLRLSDDVPTIQHTTVRSTVALGLAAHSWANLAPSVRAVAARRQCWLGSPHHKCSLVDTTQYPFGLNPAETFFFNPPRKN